ncbi:predicted protein [Phaeodactylum tricornutum CCAP 1055/1]|jgi:hypothetical protein|uniref:Uncharacterized protein n=1 Tax=Phaeodactylum tricornutum (strain CCAP 1055/1) TaxID=556484 RepID=B7G3Z8_PHATC|nr:predicted protein [Phaeodactylum tricornutum CCAP 1055/1]EEC46525.1 predicted protein [Phaeodactylum tricornutum CCAP 1055/1]|eukprot:XP_002181985.1 predicted protein [Phaeodactylum tricornutum CCAP 1055/1]
MSVVPQLRRRIPSAFTASLWLSGIYIYVCGLVLGAVPAIALVTTPLPTRPFELRTRSSARFLSDIPRDDDANSFQLPPPPEDRITLTGDLLSLFVYGFTDHFLCHDVATYFVRQASSGGPAQMLRTASQSAMSLPTPVWLEVDFPHHHAGAVMSPFQVVWQAALSDHLVSQYSPLLQSTGTATVLLATTWLLAGWWHRAFDYQNTLSCRVDQALWVTARTWMSSCALMLTVVSFSRMVCGCDTPFAFFKGDVDYILDSLTVLLSWRFIAASMLGNGGDGPPSP